MLGITEFIETMKRSGKQIFKNIDHLTLEETLRVVCILQLIT